MQLHPDFLALNQPGYDTVEIGDRVFSPVYGHGEVRRKDEAQTAFNVLFTKGNIDIWFFPYDKATPLEWRLLFWDDLDTCWPQKPKRKVHKVCWLNIDADGCKNGFDSQEEADRNAYDDRIVCVRVEYEVEE